MASRKKGADETRGSIDEQPTMDGHEDFYKRLRDKIMRWADRNELKPAYRQYLLALPDLFHLVARLVLDKRVDAVSKTLLGVALAYVVSPFDLLPDFLGPLGFIDDLLVVALAIEAVLLRTPASIIHEHWAGEADIVALVREIREAADQWVGRGMYLRIRRYLSERGIMGPEAKAATSPQAKPKVVAKPKVTSSAKVAARPKVVAKPDVTARPKRPAVKAPASPTQRPAARPKTPR